MNYRVAKELKAERVKRDLSIVDVAKALKTCGETIRRYESGTYTLTIEKIEKLLKFYNVDPSIFLETCVEICTIKAILQHKKRDTQRCPNEKYKCY